MSRLPFRHTLILAAAALSISLAGRASAQEVLDGIAAVVNNEVVTFSQVRELVASKEKSAKDTYKGEELVAKIKEIRLAAINDLIDRQLILQEFKSKGFQIPDYFIDERVTTIVRDEFGNDRSAFIRTLAAQGFTLERFRELEKDKIIVQEMRRQAIKGKPEVSDAQIAEYYKTHADDYGTPEQLKLRTITLRRNPHNDSKSKQMQEIREKIVGEKAEFGDLARMYSEDDIRRPTATGAGSTNARSTRASRSPPSRSRPAKSAGSSNSPAATTCSTPRPKSPPSPSRSKT